METEILLAKTAQRLRFLRESQGISPEKAADIGECSPSYVRRLERGKNGPTVETLNLLLNAYKSTLGKFYTAIEEEHSAEERLAKRDRKVKERVA